MAKINPKSLVWSAPTENEDGEPITEHLSYTLGIDGVETVSFPGTLNPDGRYTAKFADMSVPDGQHTIALLAFYTSNPDLKSDWSNEVDVIFGVVAPKPPFGVAVA